MVFLLYIVVTRWGGGAQFGVYVTRVIYCSTRRRGRSGVFYIL